jgi:AdoMet-dependent heme synthase
MRHAKRDYARTPLNIYWEMTQACALACRHCRAEAMPDPHPMELSFEEGVAFSARSRNSATHAATDPHRRRSAAAPDLFELIDEARSLGIGVSITPAATDALTRDVLARLKEHGVEGLGLSLDGSTAGRHDSIRGVEGTFDRTMRRCAGRGNWRCPSR